MDDHDYASAMDKAVESALTKAGVIVEAQAVRNAPVDTGRLKGSITWATMREGSADGVSRPDRKGVVHIGTNVDYAQHVEYGTVKMDMQPYLRPALALHRGRIVAEFSKWVGVFLQRGK